MILTRAYGQKRSFREFAPQWYASVEQLHNKQTQLSLRALQKNTVVEILYTSEIIDPTEKVSTFRVPRLQSFIVSRSNDFTLLSNRLVKSERYVCNNTSLSTKI